MYYVYILKSLKDNQFYVGITNNVERRLYEHNIGNCKSTKFRIPFEIVYKKECKDRSLARQDEKYLKSGVGREWIYQSFRSYSRVAQW